MTTEVVAAKPKKPFLVVRKRGKREKMELPKEALASTVYKVEVIRMSKGEHGLKTGEYTSEQLFLCNPQLSFAEDPEFKNMLINTSKAENVFLEVFAPEKPGERKTIKLFFLTPDESKFILEKGEVHTESFWAYEPYFAFPQLWVRGERVREWDLVIRKATEAEEKNFRLAALLKNTKLGEEGNGGFFPFGEENAAKAEVDTIKPELNHTQQLHLELSEDLREIWKLFKEGKNLPDIMEEIGASSPYVTNCLLAMAVKPEIIQALWLPWGDPGKIQLDHMRSFSRTPVHEIQEQIWKAGQNLRGKERNEAIKETGKALAPGKIYPLDIIEWMREGKNGYKLPENPPPSFKLEEEQEENPTETKAPVPKKRKYPRIVEQEKVGEAPRAAAVGNCCY